MERGSFMICADVPWATICPPKAPAPGPIAWRDPAGAGGGTATGPAAFAGPAIRPARGETASASTGGRGSGSGVRAGGLSRGPGPGSGSGAGSAGMGWGLVASTRAASATSRALPHALQKRAGRGTAVPQEEQTALAGGLGKSDAPHCRQKTSALR